MNPAYSVILFTTLSGAGYGLLGLLGLVGFNHGQASSLEFALACLGVALALITLGLLSSTLHLGRPERAWRAFSQWRSSWLSREGVASLITYVVGMAFGLCWSGLLQAPGWIAPLGLATSLTSAVTVFSTGKIYSTLRTIPAWHQRWTVPVYLLFALAGGAAVLMAIAVPFGRFQSFQLGLALLSLIALILAKLAYWRQADRSVLLLTADATGLKGRVRQWEAPHTSPNFVQKEMGFQVARRHARKIRFIIISACLLAGLLELGCLFYPLFSWPAALVLLWASMAERWLFFAEARHMASLYYAPDTGAASVRM